MCPRARLLGGAVGAVAASLLARPALAHVGALGGTVEAGTVPPWLVILTGGGVVGASFLFTTLMTDHATIRAINASRVGLPVGFRDAAARAARALGVAALLAVVLAGVVGPREPARNLAILVVWVGWWAGYAMSTYLVGNTWPALNPWRTLAAWLPDGQRDLPALGAWPAAAGLLALVWVEVVSPVSSSPRLLAAVVVAYTAVTLAGAAAFGAGNWFDRVDPVARVFRCYGRVAPLQRTDSGVALRPLGAALVESRDRDQTPFVVALLWVTTYDGLVSTPAWRALAGPVVGAGVPALLVYLIAAVGGFGGFLYVYRVAARLSRRTADTYVSAGFIRARFVPSLLPIAAGYHVAHFLGYFLALSPALLTVLGDPLSPPAAVPRLVLPGWFGSVALAFVLLGHLLAVWVAHAVAFETFAGRLQPIRSQYPFIVVMIFYTMTSMWVVSQPYAPPPYV